MLCAYAVVVVAVTLSFVPTVADQFANPDYVPLWGNHYCRRKFSCKYSSLLHMCIITFVSSGIVKSQMMLRHSMGTLHSGTSVKSEEETWEVWGMLSQEF